MSFDDLWIPALIAAIVLPLLSAVVTKSVPGTFLPRYLRCLVSYGIVCFLISLGYLFQGSLPNPRQSVGYSLTSGWDFWSTLVRGFYFSISQLAAPVLAGCVASFVLLVATDDRSQSANTFRAAFVAFFTLDILLGMETGFSGTEYIYNVAFDLVGAFFLSVFGPFFVRRLVRGPAKSAEL
jgi:hypothetical protein